MAQAARLNLRMQKELKLLLRDPPPCASFPLLSTAAESSTSSSVSLSSIDALIEGPEGTVYEKGLFHIKIQIPECYPFQPPIVTFGTPIYHPNIDTGGRICLDILNLPPKGAWQPSLNISTVLTSIGLLLSEPNPDDGLMCEASSEYKYNRQIFDQKARSMTEKYAKAGASRQSMLSRSSPSMMENERTSQEQKCEVISQTSSRKTSLGLSQKLSFDLSGSKKKMDSDGKFSEELNHLVHPTNCEKEVEIEGTKIESGGIVNCYNLNTEKPSMTRRKLSLNCLCQSQKKDVLSQENVLPNTHQYASSPQIDSMACLKTTSVQMANKQVEHKSLTLSSKKLCQVSPQPSMRYVDNIDHEIDKHHLTCNAESRHDLNDVKSVKPYSITRKLSLGHKRPLQKEDNDNKENVNTRNGSDQKLSYEPPVPFEERNDKENNTFDIYMPSKSRPKSQWNMKFSKDHKAKFSGQIKEVEPENSVIADTVIVLDSEDSEEEERNNDLRPKLSIARKPLARKRRV